MASASVEQAGGARTGNLLFACVAEHGSAAHPYLASDELVKGPYATRNLADAAHFLCMLHGRHPGVIDHAANRSTDPAARAWFAGAAEGFAAERAFLTKLAVTAGPMPSTPGAADNDAVLLSQRHAIEMLAQSERNGCALGAAIALVIDWGAIRGVLDVAAQRFGLEPRAYRLNETGAIRSLVEAQSGSPALQRALLFGAEQIVLQHKGLWDLIEARQQARGIY